PEVEVQRVEIWTVSWPGIFRLLLTTRPRNLSFRNSKAAFVQCGGAPSYIHQSEERVAEWRSLGQIMSWSNLRYENAINRRQMDIIFKECMNDWNHSINNGNEDH
ncbi:Uncharacterized protein FKW44_007017, partial [Caligus rogercresseyi]